MTDSEITPRSTMQQILQAFPGAQRALFREFHIGGCSSCSFKPTETLEEVCRRNNGLNVEEVLAFVRTSHAEDARILMRPKELAEWRQRVLDLKLLDIRSKQEYQAVHIAGSVLMSQPAMQEIMAHWSREEPLVIIDHQGRTALDAAAYFLGHGFKNVRCLQGGIDAWSQEVDPKLARYRLG